MNDAEPTPDNREREVQIAAAIDAGHMLVDAPPPAAVIRDIVTAAVVGEQSWPGFTIEVASHADWDPGIPPLQDGMDEAAIPAAAATNHVSSKLFDEQRRPGGASRLAPCLRRGVKGYPRPTVSYDVHRMTPVTGIGRRSRSQGPTDRRRGVVTAPRKPMARRGVTGSVLAGRPNADASSRPVPSPPPGPAWPGGHWSATGGSRPGRDARPPRQQEPPRSSWWTRSRIGTSRTIGGRRRSLPRHTPRAQGVGRSHAAQSCRDRATKADGPLRAARGHPAYHQSQCHNRAVNGGLASRLGWPGWPVRGHAVRPVSHRGDVRYHLQRRSWPRLVGRAAAAWC